MTDTVAATQCPCWNTIYFKESQDWTRIYFLQCADIYKGSSRFTKVIWSLQTLCVSSLLLPGIISYVVHFLSNVIPSGALGKFLFLWMIWVKSGVSIMLSISFGIKNSSQIIKVQRLHKQAGKIKYLGFYQVLKIWYDLLFWNPGKGHKNVITDALCIDFLYLETIMRQLMSQYVPFPSA